MRWILVLYVAASMIGCVSAPRRSNLPPLRTVDYVDLGRYAGTWYEIAAFPQRFEAGCTGTTATYTARPDGRIEVVNRCFKGSLRGKEKSAKGIARVVDSTTNAKLKVSFFRPFWGDYWIIDLGPNYEYAVVGHPGREYLWILSRSSSMDRPTYDTIVARLNEQHYETGRLVRTVQGPPSGAGR